jgi:phospholipase A-2-activating protein
MARYPVVARISDPQLGSVLDIAISSSIPDGSQLNENAAMMGARTIVNLFGTADGRSLVSSQASKAISFLERILGIAGGEAIGKFNRNVLIAVTTCVVNLSVLANKEKLLTVEQRRRLLILVGSVLKDQSDSEVLYRALVGLGTLIASSKAESKGLNISSWIREALGKSSEDRVKEVAEECNKLAPR